MKDKIIMFIIGLLVGAIVSTGVFYLYNNATSNCDCNNRNIQMNSGQPPEIPNGENGQPPERSSDDTFQSNNDQDGN